MSKKIYQDKTGVLYKWENDRVYIKHPHRHKYIKSHYSRAMIRQWIKDGALT